MSKLIAVTGSPYCGKTVFSLKLAQELQALTKKPVVFLSPDMTTPTLSLLFPHRRDKDLQSFGDLFNMTTIYTDDVLQKTVTTKSMPDLGYLGFYGKDNRYAYPTPTGDKIAAILSAISIIADYAVVDIPNEEYNVVAQTVLLQSDHVIQLGSPDVRCMAYYASQKSLLPEISCERTVVLNDLERDGYTPTNESGEFFTATFGKADFSMPYSLELKKQYMTGDLMEHLKDTRYRKKLRQIVERVAK